jgi:hypothetical protein
VVKAENHFCGFLAGKSKTALASAELAVKIPWVVAADLAEIALTEGADNSAKTALVKVFASSLPVCDKGCAIQKINCGKNSLSLGIFKIFIFFKAIFVYVYAPADAAVITALFGYAFEVVIILGNVNFH